MTTRSYVYGRDTYSNIFLDTFFVNFDNPSNSANFIFPNVNMMGIHRLGVSRISFNVDIPNVNARNNTFTVNGVNITIPEGFYATTAALGAALKTALDAAIPAQAPWTVAVLITGNFSITNATATAVTVTFPLGQVQRRPCRTALGIDTVTAQYPWVTFTPTLVYSDYFDISSNRIFGYQKGDRSSGIINGGVLARFDNSATAGPLDSVLQFENIKWINFAKTADLGAVDIRIQDEFGQPIYIPPYSQFRMVIELLTTNVPSDTWGASD